ncbi:hypothetical protein [Capybara microvirus Cap1_SP_142]|nr:hypothetical protein [Capybara microvirus Cap1_SP_142]
MDFQPLLDFVFENWITLLPMCFSALAFLIVLFKSGGKVSSQDIAKIMAAETTIAEALKLLFDKEDNKNESESKSQEENEKE